MVPVKVGAIYLTQPSMDFVESSVRSISRCINPVLIALDTSAAIDALSLRLLEQLSENGRAQIIRGVWQSRREATTALAQMLREAGVSHAMLVDPQDVYSVRDLENIVEFAGRNPAAARIQLRFHHYWKGLTYRIDPVDAVLRTVLVRLGSGVADSVLIPEEIATGHNFTYASFREAVVSRIEALGASPASVSKWASDVWDAWSHNRRIRHLHPVSPERFRSAVRVHRCMLPEALWDHPYLQYELAPEEVRSKPALSVVLLATTGLTDVQRCLNQLRATVPDDSELITCATEKHPETVEFLRNRPGIEVVVAPGHVDQLEVWLTETDAISTDRIVFVDSSVDLEGDWVEGFLAALDDDPTVVYAARSQSLPPEPDLSAVLFEARRGRYYGLRTSAGTFQTADSQCWACSRDTLEQICEADPVPMAYVEDTLVFVSTANVEAPGLDLPVGSSAASIVIPVFNNLEFTKACLESIRHHTQPGQYEVIVVDNGSNDGTREYLETLQLGVRYIRNRKNLFFAKGSNRGAWAARGDNIVFLNNDTVVKPGWLDGLLAPLEEDPRIGIVGNKQVFPESNATYAGKVWHSGITIGEDKNPWHVFYGFDSDHPLVNRRQDCPAVTGCCMLIRRPIFELLQGFDPGYQNGFEDVDLCLRAASLGHRIVYTPRSEIIHFVSSTECRFDRDATNLERFRSRWAQELIATENNCFIQCGLRPPLEDRRPVRVGLISAFNQQRRSAEYAQRLLSIFHPGACVVFSEFGCDDRKAEPDLPQVIRSWNRAGHWYYPLLRYVTSFDLDLVHVNFDAGLFPAAFLELMVAVKQKQKRIVITFHEASGEPSFLRGLCKIADAVIVHSSAIKDFILDMCDASKIHLIPSHGSPMSDATWTLYTSVLKGGASEAPRKSRTFSSANRLPYVCWEGPQMVNHSLAVVNREMEQALIASGKIELNIIPVGVDAFTPKLMVRSRRLASHYHRRLIRSTDIHVRHQWPPNWSPPSEGRWVVIQPWEYGSLPAEWIEHVNTNVDEVWAPSHFVRTLYVESGADPERVHVVPNGVDTNLFKPGLKKLKLSSRKSFTFLFVGGTIHRKGADLLLQAYTRSFTASDDVVLVIKDFGARDVYQGQGLGEKIRAMAADSRMPEILYLEQDLSDIEMSALYNACDCLVHPYRGEGFALPVLEAMSCGLAVIVTAGGATDDFVDDETGFRIPARRQSFGNRIIGQLKTAGDLWLLEPDEEALATTMRRVRENPRQAKQVGDRAREKVVAGWTWNHAAERALRRIAVLRLAPIVRFQQRADAAVLLDTDSPEWAGSIAITVESLERNSYADLQIFVRIANSSNELRQMEQRAGITILEGYDFAAAMNHIREKVRAPFLMLIRTPILFSKQWLRQMSAIANRTGSAPVLIAPATNNLDSDCGSAYTGPTDDASFQRFARSIWRNYRGQFEEIRENIQDCALVRMGCLDDVAGSDSADEWLQRLQRRGVKTYWARDTYVLRKREVEVEHTHK